VTASLAYPLAWPTGWPRTPADRRVSPRFTQKEYRAHYGSLAPLTLETAIVRLERQADTLGAEHLLISTNVGLRRDGLPRLSDRPDDPGAVAYFHLRGRPTTLPCDRYKTVAGNIAAIAAHIEATRAIERHGVGTLDQMFAGFQAIRGPGPKPWREVLGIRPDAPVTAETIEDARRRLARQHHPDAGGSDAAMAEVNAAADAALAQLRDAAA
jgi:hypothetical protein